MKIYAVGGSVRDELLGLPVKDRDFVVVGATPKALLDQGYKPVGKDFPVFLHPATHEQYALARTERKTAAGYRGFAVHFSPDVTLEEDLLRRDLTINAMARDDGGHLIDPHGGAADLQAKVLRHVSPAFAEDPVRILRVSRFAARYGDFTVAPETRELMAHMVAAGEVDALVPERVWQELAVGLMEATPSRMFVELRTCGALAKILPELDALFGVPQPAQHHPEIDTGVHLMLGVDHAARQGYPLEVRFAALTHDLGKATSDLDSWPKHYGHETQSKALVLEACRRLRVPAQVRDVALLAALHHANIHRVRELNPTTMVKLLERTDGFRRPERFSHLLLACACDFHGRAGPRSEEYQAAAIWQDGLAAAKAVPSGEIAAAASSPQHAAARIHEARVGAVRRYLAARGDSPRNSLG